MQELCAPLFKKYQLNMCVYVKYYLDGSCILLSTNQDWMHHHLTMEYLIPAPIPAHLLEKQQAFHIIPNDGPFQQAKYDLIQKYKSDQAVDFIKKGTDYFEIMCFAFPEGSADVLNVIINNLHAFSEFSDTFKDQAAEVLNNAEKHAFILPSHMAGINVNQLNPLITNANNDALTLAKAQMKDSFDVKFTSRQMEVLLHVLRGNTARETAKQLGLSCRTVEHYLLNIKNRLRVNTKSELIHRSLHYLKEYL